jgi:tyrosine-protein kinase Etk/Wzc
MINPALSYSGPPIVVQEEEEVNFRKYLDTLLDNRKLILSVALAVSLLGIAYAFLAKPVYEANFTVQVEESSQKEVKNIFGEMNSMFETKAAASAEMELLRSRLVVSRAVDNMRLYIGVRPKYFPLIGSWLAKHNKSLSTPGLFGYGGYAWGAEKMDVSVFNVPDALQNMQFVLTVGNGGQFHLYQSDKGITINGRVGVPVTVQTEYGNVELKIDEIDAKPGAQFYMSRASRISTIEEIQKKLSISEEGKQSGVIDATLQGSDPVLTTNIMTEISKEYMNQNRSRRTEEAEKSLAFLNKQLPQLKQELEESEAKLNQFRNEHGTIDLGEEAKLSLQQSAQAKLRKLDLEQRRSELLNRFTPNHPAVIGINSQIAEINEEINQATEHIKTLPLLEQNVLRLSRDVKVNTDLYTSLLNTAQQLKMATFSKVGNVRLVDTPMLPDKPVFPNRPKVIAIAILLGLCLGVLVAFIKKSMRGGIQDPAEIEHMLGVPVCATIPHSKMQVGLFDEVTGKSKRLPLLAKVSSTDVAIESLRNFRAALQYALPRAKNNIVLIAGPTQAMGKTFVSVNLAAIMAASGKRVLLIDTDLRNGHLHRYFEVGRENGLSDCIAGNLPLENIIHRGVVENMDFISTGSLPPNPSELLLHPRLGAMMQTLSSRYDLVLMDGTPILPVADTLIMGAHAGLIYVMTRAGVTTPAEVSESLKRLNQAGLQPKGVVFNDVEMRSGRYGYGYTYGKYRHTQYLPGEHPLIEASTT